MVHNSVSAVSRLFFPEARGFFMTTPEPGAMGCMVNFLWTFFLWFYSTPCYLHQMPVLVGS